MGHPRRFTPEQVRAIRRDFAAAIVPDRKGFPRLRHRACADLQRRYGVTNATLHKIARRESYADIA